MEILIEAGKKRLEKLNSNKQKREGQVNQILEEPDKEIIRKVEKRKLKRYNLSQAAKILDVPRQSLYYWIKRGWVKPKRDNKHYPVFTVFDIEKIIKWRNTIK